MSIDDDRQHHPKARRHHDRRQRRRRVVLLAASLLSAGSNGRGGIIAAAPPAAAAAHAAAFLTIPRCSPPCRRGRRSSASATATAAFIASSSSSVSAPTSESSSSSSGEGLVGRPSSATAAAVEEAPKTSAASATAVVDDAIKGEETTTAGSATKAMPVSAVAPSQGADDNTHGDDDKDEALVQVERSSPTEIKSSLLKLLSTMTGTPDDFKSVERHVNALEGTYVQVQTLGFLNLALSGDWQLLFSTNLLGVPNRNLQLREMVQKVETKQLEGSLTNVAAWDLAEDGATFDASGTFSVKCSYRINQGARMVVDLDEHQLELARGSVVPGDVEGLVGMLHRAMPKELFDPNGLAMDTTYLDGDLRIARLTGSRHEGVRNIFVRKGSVVLDPQ